MEIATAIKNDRRTELKTAGETAGESQSGSSSSKQYHCTYCNYSARWQCVVRRHERTHTRERLFTCSYDSCSYGTYDKQALNKHVEVHHKKTKPFKCDKCDFRTSHRLAFNDHRRSHNNEKPYACSNPGCGFRTSWITSLYMHERAVHDSGLYKRIPCSFPNCSYATHRKHDLKIHMLRHSDTKPHKCTEPGCEFKTRTLHQLQEHKRRHDPSRERAYKCQLCPRKYFDPSSVYVHVLAAHTKENTHKCTECNYSAAFESVLRRHVVRAHCEERAFSCDVAGCDYKAKVAVDLLDHKKRRHGPQPMKRRTWGCRVQGCEFQASSPYVLQQHQRRMHHESRGPLKCALCLKWFNTKVELQTHIRRHTKEAPLKCPNCSYATAFPYVLKKHKCIGAAGSSSAPGRSTKTKPAGGHSCKVCSLKCSCLGEWRNHIKSKHVQTIVANGGVGEIYKCLHCHCEFKHIGAAVVHCKQHKKCEVNGCDFIGMGYYEIARHKRDVHAEPDRILPTVKCPHCGRICSVCSMHMHVKACRRRKATTVQKKHEGRSNNNLNVCNQEPQGPAKALKLRFHKTLVVRLERIRVEFL